MLDCRIVATVAEHPEIQSVNAGKPFAEIARGSGVLLTSVVRPVLNGLYAAVLFVEPPSASCHSSRSATLACVAGAPTPCRMQSSHPAGSGVSAPATSTARPVTAGSAQTP